MIHTEDIDAVHGFIVDNAPDYVVKCWQSLKAEVLGQLAHNSQSVAIAALNRELIDAINDRSWVLVIDINERMRQLTHV